MIYIKALINKTEYDTSKDEQLIRFMTGTLYKKGEEYYLYCKQEILNGCVDLGLPLYESDFPSTVEKSESMILNFDDETRQRIVGLGNDRMIKREVTESITLIPTEELVKLFISEIKRSKIEIGNAIILSDKYPVIRWEGSTYGVNIHDCTFLPLEDGNIPEHDDFYIKVNPGDKVLKKQTDKRGYPACCGIENKNKDVVIIVRGQND